MRVGVRIGIDPGAVRVGVARSDPSGTLAVPLATLRRGHGDLEAIAGFVREHAAIEVVVGDPVSLRGEAGRAAEDAREYAARIAESVDPIEVRLVDERLSTAAAQRQLTEVGRKHHKARMAIDQAAAVMILQNALETEHATGTPAGTTVRKP